MAVSRITIAIIGAWGVADPDGLVAIASVIVEQYFKSGGWFVMLSLTGMLALCIWLAASKYGDIRLGKDEDRPEFSSPSWIALLFAAGMGVGLLIWAVIEALSHFDFAQTVMDPPVAAQQALLATNFHWGCKRTLPFQSKGGSMKDLCHLLSHRR